MKYFPRFVSSCLAMLSLLAVVPATSQTQMSKVKHVFIILMENHNWSGDNSQALTGNPDLKGNITQAPYINSLVPLRAHAEQYYNPAGNHPSHPNYSWLEAGTNFGQFNDNPPSSSGQVTAAHLVTELVNANPSVTWKAYAEPDFGNPDFTDCPQDFSEVDVNHLPFTYFSDTTNGFSASSATCIAHIKPYSHLATDVASGVACTPALINAGTACYAQYNYIAPNLCHQGHQDITSCSGAESTDNTLRGDTWLKNIGVPSITGSSVYTTDGALFIVWDEAEDNTSPDGPIGMFVLSPFAKTNYVDSTNQYDHSSMLKTLQEIFGVTPLLGGAANASTKDLSGFFLSSTLVSIAVVPANASIQNGATVAYSATATYSDGSTQDLTSSVTWVSSNPGVATINSSGVATGVAVNTCNITAATGGVTSNAASLSVTAATLTSISVTPASASIAPGGTQAFTATGHYSSGSTQDLTSSATWTSSNPAAATIASTGIATGVAAGTANIAAKSGSVTSNTATLTVASTAFSLSQIKNVWVIALVGHNWTGDTAALSIKGNPAAPYINNTLLPMGAHAEQYFNPPGIHPSLPNYLWLESASTFSGFSSDTVLPSINNIQPPVESPALHLVTQLGAHSPAINWKVYAEPDPTTFNDCPLDQSEIDVVHVPMLYFADSTGDSTQSNPFCQAHIKPYSQLATDLASGTVPGYSFIVPSQCDDMTTSYDRTMTCSPGGIAQADTWLSNNLPAILNSAAYKSGGAVFITWDQANSGDGPIGMIVLSPFAKVNYSNVIKYDHSSTLKTLEEIFGVTPLLGAAANASTTDLRDLFQSGPPPTLSSIAITPSSASIPAGATQAFTAAGTYSNGSTSNLTNSVTWVSSNQGAATINSSGVATGVAAGSSSISASMSGVTSNTASVTVPTTLTSISVTPTSASIAAGGTQAFTATGHFSNGTSANISSSATWVSSNTGVATINSSGLATGVTSGTSNITAASSGVTSNAAALTVISGVSVSILPGATSMPVNSVVAFTAAVAGTSNAGVTWTLAGPGVLAPSSTILIPAAVQYTAPATSATGVKITATSQADPSKSVSAIFNVTPTSPMTMAITAPSPVPAGSCCVTVTGVTPLSATVTGGTGAVAVDFWDQISVHLAGVQGTGTAYTTSFNTPTLAVPPPQTSFWFALLAQATDASGNTISTAFNGVQNSPLTLTTNSLAFPSQTQGVASTLPVTITNIGTTSTAGSTVNGISAAFSGANAGDFTLGTGSNACPTAAFSLTVTPAAGSSCIFYVSFNPHAIGVRSAALSLTSSATGNGNAGGTAGPYGNYTPLPIALSGTGTSGSTASVGPTSLVFGNQAAATTSAAQNVILTNNGPAALTIASIGFTGSNASDFAQTNGCGSSLAASGTCSISVTFTPAVAGSRSATLTLTDNASNSPQTASLSGTGVAATLVSIAVTPASASASVGGTQSFTATGTYSNGSTQNLTGTATWTSSSTSVATVSSSGVATGVAAGTANITAKLGSVTSNAATLTVTAPTLNSIAVSPTSASIAVGGTQGFTATGTYSNGSTQNLTGTATWASSNTTAAAIVSTGVATGKAAGSTNITAQSGSVISNAGALTVTAASPLVVSVTVPTYDAVVHGVTTLTATASGGVGGVASVQFILDQGFADQQNMGAAITNAPYSTTFNFATISPAYYNVTAVATDTSGKTATNTVEVNNQ